MLREEVSNCIKLMSINPKLFESVREVCILLLSLFLEVIPGKYRER